MQMVNGLMLDFLIIRRTVKRSQPMSEQNMSMATEQFFIHLLLLKSLTDISMIFYYFPSTDAKKLNIQLRNFMNRTLL